MHRIALMTLKKFLYYLCSTESWTLNVRRLMMTLWFRFSRATNFMRVWGKCHLSITHKWIKYWRYRVSSLCTQLGAKMRSEGCQLQRNTQLRASLFTAKIWYERLNVIAKCVSDGVLSGNYNVQPPSWWLFHGSVTSFSFSFVDLTCLNRSAVILINKCVWTGFIEVCVTPQSQVLLSIFKWLSQ